MTGGYAQQTSTPEGGMQTQPPQTGMHFTSFSSLLLWQTMYIVKNSGSNAIAIEFMHDMV